MTLSELAARLERPKSKQFRDGPGYVACCPAHDDKTPSFAVWESADGWLHFKCQAGCSEDEILAALGMTQEDRMSSSGRMPTTEPTTYTYTDAKGEYLFEKRRFVKAGGGKTFGLYVHDEKGVSHIEDWSDTLYNLPAVMDAICFGETVYVSEGEKACDALAQLGLAATCQPLGAEAERPHTKWKKAHTEALRLAEHVVIVADRDPVGEGYALYVKSELEKAGCPDVQIVQSATTSEKDDAYDHLKAGFGIEDFVPYLGEPEEVKAISEDPLLPKAMGAFNLTDAGNAERLAEKILGRCLYVHPWRQWLYYDGMRWIPDEEGGAYVVRTAVQVARELHEAADKITDENVAKAAKAWARKSESRAGIENMIHLARSLDGLSALPDQFDADPWLLNCLNGTVDLRTGKLRPHDSKDRLTKMAGADYNPEADQIEWKAFLKRILPDEELRLWMAKAVGYSLTGVTDEQIMLFCHGLGANGKTTFLETVAETMGDYARSAPPELLAIKRFDSGGPTPELARLKGARLVTIPETEDGKKLAESLVKRLTGGEKIVARNLHAAPFEFEMKAKMWMSGNHRPVITGDDRGVWRRIRLIPFEVTIPDAERDPALRTKLSMNLSAVLAWAVQGCLRWQDEGLGIPEAVRAATGEYQTDMDILGAFLEECCDKDEFAECPATELWAAYDKWSSEGAERKMTQTMLGIKLRERGFTKKRLTSGIVYEGISLAEKDTTASLPYKDD